jgi:hypothetical protein
VISEVAAREPAPSAAGDDDLEVLFVSGAPRSGSTILGMILGQLDGCCDVGELWALWRPAYRNGDLCGCGLPVNECGFWSLVIRDALGPDFAERGPALGRLHRRMLGTLRAPFVWAHIRGWRRRPEYAEYAQGLADHYRAIAAASGARIVVDSSKMASDALIATTIAGVRVSVVHIVRDPRGVAWSWKKHRRQPGPQGRQLDRHGIGAVAARWLAYNAFAELLLAPRSGTRFRRVRYEDLLADPARITTDLTEWFDIGPSPIPIAGDPPRLTVDRPTHPVWGNPVRTASGDLQLRVDDEWRTHMSRSERLTVALMTFPLFLRYGYWRRRS